MLASKFDSERHKNKHTSLLLVLKQLFKIKYVPHKSLVKVHNMVQI
jgi:hypothetical protein